MASGPTIGGTVATIGAVLAGVGLAEESSSAHSDVWSNAWFLLGGAVFVLGSAVVVVVVVVVIAVRRSAAGRSRRSTDGVPTFSLVEPIVEFVGNTERRGTDEFGHRSLVWVRVKNDGPEAEFSAYFSLHTDTARREHPTNALTDSYSHNAAWEDTLDRKIRIGHSGSTRLHLMWTFMTPHPMFWFMLPQQDLYGPGYAMGWILSPLDDVVVFDLRVVNETTQHAVTVVARLELAESGKAERLILEPLSSPSA